MANKKIDEFLNKPSLDGGDLFLIETVNGEYYNISKDQLFTTLGGYDLATTLGVGNTTGEQDIISDNGKSTLSVINGHVQAIYSDGLTNTTLIKATSGEVYLQSGSVAGVKFIKSAISKNEFTHDISNDFNAPTFNSVSNIFYARSGSGWEIYGDNGNAYMTIDFQSQKHITITSNQNQFKHDVLNFLDSPLNVASGTFEATALIKTGGTSSDFLKADGSVDSSTYLTTAAAAAAYQPLDSDLTSWAAITRASGFDTFVATPSSANLASLVTDETGTGALVFANTPTFTTPILGTPTSGTLTNCSGLVITTGTTGTLTVARGGTNLTTVASGSILAANSADVLTAITSTSGSKGLINDSGVISWATVTGTGAPVRDTAPTFQTSITGAYLTADRALRTDSSKNIISSVVTATEQGYLSGVTSAIQTQLNAKYTSIQITSSALASPADSTTYYFGHGRIIPNTTASSHQFKLPAGTIVGYMISAANNTTAGSNENSTLQLRNVSQSTSSSIGTFTTNATALTGTTFANGSCSIATNTSDFYSLQWDTPAWGTNPANTFLTVTFYMQL